MPLDITRFIFTLISSLVFFCQPASADGSSELTVGIVPQQSASALAAAWIPMLSEAAKRAGCKAVLLNRSPENRTAEHERLSKGTPVRCCSLMETVTSLSIIPCEQERLT